MVRRILLAAFVSAVSLAIYMIRIAPHWLRVTRLKVALPGLPPIWRGVRIAHLSDFHLGAWGMTGYHLHTARNITLEFEPDIIALTGDFYDSGKDTSPDGLYDAWGSGVPVFAVMGNHDRRGVPGTLARIQAEQERAGVIILDNEASEFGLRGQPAWVVGVDDAHTFHADVDGAFGMLPGGEIALLFLSHAPAPVRDLPEGRARLMLAGHTHGGQVRILPSGRMPLTKWIRKLRGARDRPEGPVYRGWHWMKGTVLVVSDGLGVSTLPIRFLTRPHLILIELDCTDPHADLACDDVNRYVTDLAPEPWPLSMLS
ncbi:metallophosphoesterase [soil metagenome]